MKTKRGQLIDLEMGVDVLLLKCMISESCRQLYHGSPQWNPNNYIVGGDLLTYLLYNLQLQLH